MLARQLAYITYVRGSMSTLQILLFPGFLTFLLPTLSREEPKNFDVSKGTIRLQWNKALPTELIQKIARWCYENYSGWQKVEVKPMNVVLVNGEKRA